MHDSTADAGSPDSTWSTLMAAQAGDEAASGRLLREQTPLIRRGVAPDLRIAAFGPSLTAGLGAVATFEVFRPHLPTS